MVWKPKSSVKGVKNNQRLNYAIGHFRSKVCKRNYAGVHLLADFWFGKKIESTKKIEKILLKAAKKSKSVPLKIAVHKFYPLGLTGVVLLSDSHIAIHTWPELNYIAIDIFTCGMESMPRLALRCLKEEFAPKTVKIKEIKRGKK